MCIGSEPTVKDGIVTRQACKVAPNECCAEKFEIKVVNCSLFTAYCLTPLRRCEERYCFGKRVCCCVYDLLHYLLCYM